MRRSAKYVAPPTSGLQEDACPRHGMREFQYVTEVDAQRQSVIRMEFDLAGVPDDKLARILRYVELEMAEAPTADLAQPSALRLSGS